jgi:DNA repair protein RadC
MIIELNSKHKNCHITSAAKAYSILQTIFGELDEIDKDKEHFFVIGLKKNRQIKYLEVVTIGILSSTLVHAREVFRRAIVNASDSIIIAHNHPSGNVEPSLTDDAITKSIKEAGKIIGIEVVDHVVFTLTEYYSYADNGNL